MSEKKERGEGGFHAPGTHPTNAMRANAGTGSYAGDSADRNKRVSQPSTFNQAKPSKFIPHAVRSAGLRKQGYTPSEAKRIASFQTSTAGLAQAAQNTGAPGELPDARFNPPMNQSSQGGRRSGVTSNSEMVRETALPETEEVAGQSPQISSPSSPEVGSDEWRKGVTTARTTEQQAQGNFSKSLKAGTITPDKIKQAEAFAASKGWNFDAKKGYSMGGGSGDPEGKGGTASFKRPDGTMREIGATDEPKEVISSEFKDFRGGPSVSQEYMDKNPEKYADSVKGGQVEGEFASQSSEAPAQGFKKEEFDMLPDSIEGRRQGAAAGKSYKTENGEIWRNDGEGGYSIEKPSDDNFRSGGSDSVSPASTTAATAGAVSPSNNKSAIDTRTVATLDQPAAEKPKSEPAVKSGKDLKKEVEEPWREIYPPERIQQGFNKVKDSVLAAVSNRRDEVGKRGDERREQRIKDFDDKLFEVNSRREKLGKPPVDTLSGGFKRPGSEMLKRLQTIYKSGNMRSNGNISKADANKQYLAIAKKHGFKFSPDKGFYR